MSPKGSSGARGGGRHGQNRGVGHGPGNGRGRGLGQRHGRNHIAGQGVAYATDVVVPLKGTTDTLSVASIAPPRRTTDTGEVVPFVDQDLCIGCGICASFCPEGAIMAEEETVIDSHKCTGCGVCADKCPTEAIRLVTLQAASQG